MHIKAESSRSRAGDLGIGAHEFKCLRTGEAVVINPTAKRSARFVRVSRPGAGTPGGEPL